MAPFSLSSVRKGRQRNVCATSFVSPSPVIGTIRSKGLEEVAPTAMRLRHTVAVRGKNQNPRSQEDRGVRRKKVKAEHWFLGCALLFVGAVLTALMVAHAIVTIACVAGVGVLTLVVRYPWVAFSVGKVLAYLVVVALASLFAGGVTAVVVMLICTGDPEPGALGYCLAAGYFLLAVGGIVTLFRQSEQEEKERQ